MLSTHQVLCKLMPLQKYMEEEYKDRLKRLILFGSQARGEALPTSDIDILIVLQDPVNASIEIRRTSKFISEFCLENNLLVSRLFLSESRFELENSPLLRNIRQEGISL